MTDRTGNESPSPFPPHPNQTELITQQEQREPINPPRIKYKSSFIENQDNDSLLNASPVANLKISKKELKSQSVNYQPKKREELIEANYLKKILNKDISPQQTKTETKLNSNQKYINTKPQSSSNEVPYCCYAPPCINYVNGCKDIKVSER